MAVFFLKLSSITCAVLSLHRFVLSSATEVKVIQSELKLCGENQRVCVTEPTDCDPPSPSSVQRDLNMWCSYHQSESGDSSMTCGWSLDSESAASLIFTSEDQVFSCPGIFNLAATFNVSARIRGLKTGAETWSEPRTVTLYQAVQPPRPSLTPLSEDSLLVSWRSSADGSCRLRHRLNHTHVWTQAPGSVPVSADQNASYVMKGLLPFTVYSAAVSCRTTSGGVWTVWSADASERTRDRAPSSAPEVCYRVEGTHPDGSLLLRLLWKPLDSLEAGFRVLGYTVRYSPGGLTHNVTGETAVLTVKEHNGSATVAAFNTAGSGPATRVQIDPQGHSVLPAVRHLWISSLRPGDEALRVQWRCPEGLPSAPPLGHYAVLWRLESEAVSRWSAVSSFDTSAVIRDVDPKKPYLVSVFPVYKQQCGPAQSLPASVQRGALVEAAGLKVVSFNKTSVTVMWAWQQKRGPMRVESYRAMLKGDRHTQTRSIWPDQNRLTFSNLTPSTEYSLHLLADDSSTHIVQQKTHFDEKLLVTPVCVLLLLLSLLIVSVLSRTVYKSYCFPPVSDPRDSTSCRWPEDPGSQQKLTERKILDLRGFQVTGSLIVVSPSSRLLEDPALTASRPGHKPDPHWAQTPGEGRVEPAHLPAGYQVICSSDYLMSSVLLGGQTDGSDLVCEADYRNPEQSDRPDVH
ncbi:interleukin-6 receptor subunit beta-like isoform X1 [Salarias fasciatus]|uniref:interleukin-6 receptor subunit beta-like isoform X1 n=1 Tax=Salarias fasciatus TaxID=181472 RepID=UPI001176AD28|nr:interleukin-6 receptor subunit beta-like isoform X1 [Salarias fasciatus]